MTITMERYTVEAELTDAQMVHLRIRNLHNVVKQFEKLGFSEVSYWGNTLIISGYGEFTKKKRGRINKWVHENLYPLGGTPDEP